MNEIQKYNAEFENNALLNANPEEMTLEELHVAFSLLKHFTKIVGTRQKELKGVLSTLVEEHGERISDKSTKLEQLGSSVRLTQNERIKIEEKKVQALLEEKGIGLEAGGEYTWSMNERKIEDLVAAGKITPNELEACSKVSSYQSLTVGTPPKVQELISDAKRRGEAIGEGTS